MLHYLIRQNIFISSLQNYTELVPASRFKFYLTWDSFQDICVTFILGYVSHLLLYLVNEDPKLCKSFGYKTEDQLTGCDPNISCWIQYARSSQQVFNLAQYLVNTFDECEEHVPKISQLKTEFNKNQHRYEPISFLSVI